jgi:hypothetical protein
MKYKDRTFINSSWACKDVFQNMDQFGNINIWSKKFKDVCPCYLNSGIPNNKCIFAKFVRLPRENGPFQHLYDGSIVDRYTCGLKDENTIFNHIWRRK